MYLVYFFLMLTLNPCLSLFLQPNINNNSINTPTSPTNHPQYRNPPPPMSSSSHSGTPVAVTPMPYTDVRPGGMVAFANNVGASSTLPRGSLRGSVRGSRASSPPVAGKAELPGSSGLVVNLPPATLPHPHHKSLASHPSSLSGGVVLNPTFTSTAPHSTAPRHSSTSPAILGAEGPAGAVGT